MRNRLFLLALSACALAGCNTPSQEASTPLSLVTVAIPIPAGAAARCARPVPTYTTKGGERQFILQQDDAISACNAKRRALVKEIKAYDASIAPAPTPVPTPAN